MADFYLPRESSMIDLTSISKTDLDARICPHYGNLLFARSLEVISNGNDLLWMLGRYVQFNSVFVGGVVNLAGEIAGRQNLFRDPQESVAALGDRSVEVAATILFAGVDEFRDRVTHHRGTHRALAQAMLKGAGRFFGFEAKVLDGLTRSDASTVTAMTKVLNGYGVSQTLDDHKLFDAIGFHVASEYLADSEFRILDAFLRSKHSNLVERLEQTKEKIGSKRHPAYLWIRLHTTVEQEHYAVAMRGANRALRYYAGTESRDGVKRRILGGAERFAVIQAEFMQRLARQPSTPK